jgi:hypothetical protein
MKERIDIDKIAKALGAERRGKVPVSGGPFGAMQLVAEVQARFRVPSGGGRATDPSWTKRRLVPLADQTLERLEQLARNLEEKRHMRVEPMQVAALLLENITESIADEDIEQIVDSAGGSR